MSQHTVRIVPVIAPITHPITHPINGWVGAYPVPATPALPTRTRRF